MNTTSKNYWATAINLHEEYKSCEWRDNNLELVFDFILAQNLPSPKSALELGCGGALNLKRAQDEWRKCKITGIDINQHIIDWCANEYSKNSNFICANLADASIMSQFKDKQFDIGFTSGFLMHIQEGQAKADLISEFIRVCKYGTMFEHFENNNELIYNEGNYNNCIYVIEDYRKYAPDKIILSDVKNHASMQLFYFENY